MTDHYVIYDQFHWLNPDHLERHVIGTWQEAVEQYCFYKSAFPGESLGLVNNEQYNKIKPKNYETRIRQQQGETGT